MSSVLSLPAAAAAATVCWVAGVILEARGHPRRGRCLYLAGIGILAAYLATLWLQLERPPMRTLGETRLWYAFLLPSVSFYLAVRWHIRWPLAYGAAMAVLFLGINLLHPEALDKALMPALRSPWFVPHVVVYMLAYAFLTASALGGLRVLLGQADCLPTADRAVWTGLALLTMGLLFGALWAKEAWGHYWTWDPKETWAFLTWAFYLSYVHVRLTHPQAERLAAVFLVAAVLVLATCWFGVNYLPTAASSIHAYGN